LFVDLLLISYSHARNKRSLGVLATLQKLKEFVIATKFGEAAPKARVLQYTLILSALPVRHWRVNTGGRACTRCLSRAREPRENR